LAEETDFEIGLFTTFGPQWPWPWIGSYGIPSCITHASTSTYTTNFDLFSIAKKICAQTDGQTLRQALLGRIAGVDIKTILTVKTQHRLHKVGILHPMACKHMLKTHSYIW